MRDLLLFFMEHIQVLEIAVALTALYWLIKNCTISWHEVGSASMVPTIMPGSTQVLNRFAYSLRLPFLRHTVIDWKHPKRGDVIMFLCPNRDYQLLGKRIIGMPGDDLRIEHGVPYVNGECLIDEDTPEELEETLKELKSKKEKIFTVWEKYKGRYWKTLRDPEDLDHEQKVINMKVPEGCYFVMGDNREHSTDSREFGVVPRSLICAKLNYNASEL